MQETILVLNIGSASVKFTLFSTPSLEPLFFGHVDITDKALTIQIKDNKNNCIYQHTLDESNYKNQQEHALNLVLNWLHQQEHFMHVKAVGHRVVHGGEKFSSPVKIIPEVILELEKLIPLAPLHQPYNIAGIKSIFKNNAKLLQVACFDTAFHAQESDIARSYALPENITPLKIQSYGFHGLSYQYISETLPEPFATQKNIIAHLGNGASLCATEDKKSIATTMGFTPLDGLPMGTRCGSIDPGVILYLLSNNMITKEITDLLYNRSGLLGVSGISSDMRTLLNSKEANAKKAIELFVYRTVREIGSLIAALGGLDNLIFTAGIGEHSPAIRQLICDKLSWLNVNISAEFNVQNAELISTETSKVNVWVIPTNEELVIAKQTLNILEKISH
ncbi:MAG: acetate/propionate family kinase [Gammaproteobacteria bacterium]|nr:acetate/propionate family kinase [Gammaproteobacteria bacterium]